MEVEKAEEHMYLIIFQNFNKHVYEISLRYSRVLCATHGFGGVGTRGGVGKVGVQWGRVGWSRIDKGKVG